MRYADWNISEYRASDLPALEALGIPPLVAAVLSARGVGSPDAACAHLSDEICTACDPMTMADMPKAAARVEKAIACGETIAVYGDYDVDGITACCLLVDYLRSRGAAVLPYIPDRIEEGYGLNTCAIRGLKEKGASLLVTVDCGITARDEVEFAKSLGLDVVITDHHECKDYLPDAVAVVDPKRPDCPYKYKTLAGVGVAFKLVCAMEGFLKTEALLEKLGDFVAIGTIADVMPVTGENRVFIRRGLKAISRGIHPGINALFSEAGICRSAPTCSDIGFSLAPRLNAAGRMKNARLAARLLLSEDEAEAAALSRELCDLNAERRRTEREIYEEALQILGPGWPYGMPIVLESDTWHQGVVGIVASRLAEHFRAPVILICLDGDSGRGSCRSFGGFNLYAALDACSAHLTSFGGHELAAGVNIRRDQIGDFRGAFCAYYAQNRLSVTAPNLDVDFDVDRADLLSLENVEQLHILEPCGLGNPTPTLCMTNVCIGSVNAVGDGSHTRIRFNRFSTEFDCIFFFRAPTDLRIRRGSRVDVAFTPQINEFRGRRSVQLVLTELRPCLDQRRRLEQDFDLCERHRLGCRLSQEEIEIIIPIRKDFAALVPTRNEFAALWRALSSGTIMTEGSFRDVLQNIAFIVGGSVATQYICLRVFDELGLLRLQETGEMLRIELLPGRQKVDLNKSEILKSFSVHAEQLHTEGRQEDGCC